MAASVPSRKVWMSLFSAAGLPSDSIGKYADIFASERLRLEMVVDLSRSELEELGITALGDQLAIKKHAEKMLQEQRNSSAEDSESDADRDRHRHTHQPRKRVSDADIHRQKSGESARSREKPPASSRLAPAKKQMEYSDEESDSDDNSKDFDDDDEMDVDADKVNIKKSPPLPSHSARSGAAVHRLRVVRKDEVVERSESKRALRMLTAAANTAASSQREPDDRTEEFGRNKMRSDMISSSATNRRDKNLPPPEPVNNLSRLASPQPVLQPVLIRNLKSTMKAGALNRLGPRRRGGGSLEATSDHASKQSALARLDRGGVDAKKRFTEQRGNIMLRTIQGLGTVEKLRGRRSAPSIAKARSSALQRLGPSRPSEAPVGEAPHPLSRC